MNIKVPKLTDEQAHQTRMFRDKYPKYSKFKFWKFQNQICGQKFEDNEYVGNVYIFDFENNKVTIFN